MNINATETELAATTEALKLAAILDDRAPKADKARIVAWAEQIHRHRLTREDLLDGLQNFYDQPNDRAITIGDLVHHARLAKRARVDREEDAERAARETRRDTIAADEVHAVAASVLAGRIAKRERTPRLAAAEAALQTCRGKQESLAAIREYFNARHPTKAATPVPGDTRHPSDGP